MRETANDGCTVRALLAVEAEQAGTAGRGRETFDRSIRIIEMKKQKRREANVRGTIKA
jgi:hypothetical protein